MSIAEQLSSPDLNKSISAPYVVAREVLRLLDTSSVDNLEYRPDFMADQFAQEIADELHRFGVNATVAATWLKRVRSAQGSSFALHLGRQLPDNVIPFPVES